MARNRADDAAGVAARRRADGRAEAASAPRDQRETSFARLSDAYQRSAETFPRLRVWGEGRREFQRASYLMDQISDAFNRHGVYSPGQ